MAIYDVTGAFNDLLEPVKLIRPPAGSFDHGIYQTGIPEERTIQAVLKPINDGADPELIPEGYRDKELRKLYTTEPIYPAGQLRKAADVIEADGAKWEAISSKNWARVGGFYRTIVAKLKD